MRCDLARRGAAAIAVLSVIASAGCTPQSDFGASPLGDRTRCTTYDGLPSGWRRNPHAGQVLIEGGRFRFGSERGYREERPLADTSVKAFWIDRTEVTNAQFASFVAATGYITQAERRDGGSLVFGIDPVQPTAPGSWWHLVAGASWRHPEGPRSTLEGHASEPVVDVSYADALAYATWLGRSLPSEAQWEFAAKAGRPDAAADSALRDAAGRPQANFWQGVFPLQDRAEDGFQGRAPVGCYTPNPYGLHDMVGNVWEWTGDIWTEDHAARTLAELEAAAPSRRTEATRRVIKGGSYLCSADYCVRARAASRQGEEEDLPAVHLGFRTVSPAS